MEKKVTQRLKIKPEIIIEVPEGMIMVPTAEYEDLKENEKLTWNSLVEFCEWAGWSPATISSILLKPSVRNRIDIERSDDGWAYYGLGKGQHWWFLVEPAKEFIKNELKHHLKQKNDQSAHHEKVRAKVV